MKSDANTIILEDDLYSLNWMSLLLVRDWRTRVIGEVCSQQQLERLLQDESIFFDMILMDVDIFGKTFDVDQTMAIFNAMPKKFKVLCIGSQADCKAYQYASFSKFCGFILKQEIGYSLGWALSFANEGEIVFTPSTYQHALNAGLDIPKNKLILRGRTKFAGFTDRETEVARLAIIFSIGRRDLADELKISDQWSYGLVSELYNKMGLSDLFTDLDRMRSYFGDNEIIQRHIDEIMESLGSSKKAKDMETLAFHLLTMPDFEE